MSKSVEAFMDQIVARNPGEPEFHQAVREKDFVNYVKGANIAGFRKIANAMLAQGVV